MSNPIDSTIPRVSVRDMNFRSAAARGRQTSARETGQFQEALAASTDQKEAAAAPAGNQSPFSRKTPAAAARIAAFDGETTTPASAASQPSVSSTSGSTAAADTSTGAGATMNVFSRDSVENWMNTWLIGQVNRENAAKVEVYNQAMENWKLNDANCRALGLPAPPQPTFPDLAPAGPMPAGWWFNNNNA